MTSTSRRESHVPTAPNVSLYFCVALMVLLANSVAPTYAPAQLRVRRAPVDLEEGRYKPTVSAPGRAVIHRSATMANLFARAEEGIARSDWKLAIDSLQRIVTSAESSLVVVPASADSRPSGTAGKDATRYESAQLRAMRRLSQLPSEGLAAYRLLYNGQAKGLLDRASASGDVKRLRTVVEQFLLTSYGDDAADRLASWLLDAGEAGEALAVIDMVFELVPDRDVPDVYLMGKTAVANAMLGRSGEASLALGAMTERPSFSSFPPAQRGSLRSLVSHFTEKNSGQWGLLASPPIEPTLVEPLPWVYSFEESASNGSGQYRFIKLDDSQFLSPWQAVLDGDRLYVRSPQGVAALRADDLSQVWSTTQQLDTPSGFGGQAWEAFSLDLHSWIRPPNDDLFGSISTSHGLVYAIDRQGAGSAAEARGLSLARRFGRMMPGTDALGGLYLANRLVAYEMDTGEIAWSRGRSNDADPTNRPTNELGDVEFRSVPVTIGKELWVPYFRQRDYYVGVLDPSDGSLLHEILLCSVDARTYVLRPAQPLSYGDGNVYVPSGHGVLFAIDVRRHTLRWAAQYAAHTDSETDKVDWYGSQWLPSAPIVAGGQVLLCPTDYPEVLAFSTGNGRLRWSAAIGGGSHPIMADHERIWFGGTTVSSISLEDGRELWALPLKSAPTGRAVLSGDRLFVPTSEALIILNASTGKVLAHQTPPPSQRPLGNLICGKDALYSVGNFGVRRYPDIAKSYSATLARYELARHDVSLAYNLAWLELFQSSPTRALSVLEAHRTALSDDETPAGRPAIASRPAGIDDRIAHVWVEALLNKARELSGSPLEALRLYEQADGQARICGEVARSGADRLRCALSLADQFVSMRKYLRACRTLWSAGLSVDGEEHVDPRKLARQSPMVRGSVRLAIGDRLRVIAIDLPETAANELRQFVNDEIDDATEKLKERSQVGESLRRLRAVAELVPDSAEGQRALFILGRFRYQQRRFESAEQFLLSAIRSGTESVTDRPALRVTAAALMTLCDVYRISQPDSVEALTLRLEELRHRFGGDPIPTDYDAGDDAAVDTVSNSETTISDWVATVQEKLPTDATVLDVRANESSAFVLNGDVAWTLAEAYGTTLGRMVEFDVPGTEATGKPALHGHSSLQLTDRLLLLDERGAACISTQKGTELWHTRLRLPGQFRDLMVSAELDTDVSRRAVASGQTAVLAVPDGYLAVGLISGKRLWSKPFTGDGQARFAGVRAYDPWYADMRMAIGEGVVAVLTRSDRVALLQLANGRTIWERDLRGESITYLWVVNDIVMTADERLERTYMLDRADGRLVKRVLFRQPDPDDEPVRLVHTAGVICGPNSTAAGDAILAIDAATGERLWENSLDKPLVQLFVPREGYIGIGMLQGSVEIVSARTGETILERHVPAARAIEYGVLLDGLLIVQRATPIAAGRRRVPGLVAIDIATGELVWHRNDLAAVAGVNRALYVIDGVIPAVVEYAEERLSRFKAKGLVMIDARSGRNIGADVKLVPSESRTRVLNDFRILADRIVVGTETEYLALRTVPLRTEDEGAE